MMRVHHVGSTAIPGIAAKPVIDILAVVTDLDALDQRAERLVTIGYEALGEFGIPRRRYFRRNSPSGSRTHQVHAFPDGHDQIERMLLFRDYLRATPTAAQEYEALKYHLAARSGDAIQQYAESKTEFVEMILSKARIWASEVRAPQRPVDERLSFMIQRILNAARRRSETHPRPVLIALDGPSGAGKSTVAVALAETARSAGISTVIVPGDDFFAADITAAEWDARDASARARDAIDWRRLRQDALEPLRDGRAAEWRPFDFAAGERPDGTYPMAGAVVRREPAPLIILDGAYSSRPELADLIDLSVLIEVPALSRERRLAQREAPAFLAAWHARWDAAEAFYFTHIRPAASFDLVVDGGG